MYWPVSNLNLRPARQLSAFTPAPARSDSILTINVGGQALVADEEISGANRFPTRDQDLLAEFGALPGERIFVQARNTTAGAITSNLLVDVLPV